MNRTIISLGELGASIAMVVLSLYLVFRFFAPAMARLDIRRELLRGNIAAAIVVAAIMICPTLTLLNTITPMTYLVRSYFMSGLRHDMSELQLFAYVIGYFALILALALLATWIAIRFFAFLTSGIDEFEEIRKGNVAVALVLASVVGVVSLFMHVGTAAIGGSLVPQTQLGEIRTMP